MISSGEYGQPLLRTTAVSTTVISNSGTVTVGGVRSGNMLLYDGTYATPGTVPNDGPYTTTKATCTARLRVNNLLQVAFNGTNYPNSENQTLVEAKNTGTTGFSFDLCETNDYGPSGARTILQSFSLNPLGMQTANVLPTQRYLEIWGDNGSGSLRLQLSSKIRWDEMGFAKDDPTTPPILSAATSLPSWNQLAAGGDFANVTDT